MSSLLEFDSIPSHVKSRVIKLSGTAHASVGSLEVGTSLATLATVRLTSGKRFSAVLQLTPGRNEFIFQPYSAMVTPMTAERLVIYYDNTPVELHSVGNSLDFHAAEMGYSRLFGEKNVSLKERLLQAGTETSPVVAISTELASPISVDMVRFYVERTSYNRPKYNDAFVKVSTSEVSVAARELVNSDSPVRFDSGHPYYTPASEVSPFGSLTVYSESGEPLPPDAYEYLVDTNRVWLRDLAFAGKDLMLVYNTVVSVPITGTLANLKTAIELATDLVMEITATDYHTTATSASWLVPEGWQEVDNQEDFPNNINRTQPGAYISVSEVRAYPLHEFSRDLLVGGSGLGTKLEKYVKEVNEVDHRTWDKIVVGRDGLRDANINPRYDYFPHLTDSARGSWGPDGYNRHEVQYLGSGYLDTSNPFVGVPLVRWQSGTGQLGDLESGNSARELSDYTDELEEEETTSNPLYGIL